MQNFKVVNPTSITEKTKTITLSTFYLVVLLTKGVWTRIFYPVAYLFYDWTMKGVTRQNYVIPQQIKDNIVKWFFWLHYDDAQPSQGSYEFQRDFCGCSENCTDKWERFKCAYKWNTRNSMYNVNYNYLSNQSPIVSHKVSFGDYEWDRKLRRRNGDLGKQLVWFTTEKGQYRFLFSYAGVWFGKNITTYFGWNTNANGRFTLAFKVK